MNRFGFGTRETGKRKRVWTVFALVCLFFVMSGCDDSESTDGPVMTYYKDFDGDGYSDGTVVETDSPPAGYYMESDLISLTIDCDDDNALIYPDAVDFCGDGIDQNCDTEDTVCTLSGSVDLPGGVRKSDVAVTNFSSYATLGTTNSYETEKNGVSVAADKEGNVLYMAFPDQTDTLNLNAEETAVFLILRPISIFVSNEGIVAKNIKEYVLSYPEVEVLVSAIEQNVLENGFFNFDDVQTEYETAMVAVVTDLFQYVGTDERVLGRGVTTIDRYRNDLKVEITDYEILTDDRYLIDVNVFSKVPAYHLGTLVRTGVGRYEEIENAPFFYISPMNTSDFLQTFFVVDDNYYRGDPESCIKLWGAVEELYQIMSGDIDYTQTTWDARKTTFQTEVSPEANALLFNADSIYTEIMNATYMILKGLSVAGDAKSVATGNASPKIADLEKIFEKVIKDPEIYADAVTCIESEDCWLVEKIADKVIKIFSDTVVDLGTAQAVESFYGQAGSKALNQVLVTIKAIKGSAKVLDVLTMSFNQMKKRPNTYFIIIDTTPPEILEATLINDDVHFSFDYSTPFTLHELTGYRLYKSTDGENWVDVAETTDMNINEISIYDLDPGKHYFKATVYAGQEGITGAETEYSEVVEVVVQGEITGPPEQVTAEAVDGGITVEWSEVPNAFSYNLYCSYTVDGMEQEVVISEILDTSFTHQGVESGIEYHYRVSAVGQGSQESELSSPASATPNLSIPGKPSNLSAVPEDGQVILSWTPGENADTHRVYMNTEPWNGAAGEFEYTEMKIDVACPFTYSGLQNGIEYFFIVSAENDAGENRSDAITAIPTAQTPDPRDVDDDGDGYTENQGDCKDADPAIHPGAEDICGDGTDQDCVGGDALCAATWYKDADGDGYSEGSTMDSVDRPAGYRSAASLTATTLDCDDDDPAIHPGAEDICGDEIDQDCVGGDALCAATWYKDADGDGYSDGTTTAAVDQPAGYYPASWLNGLSGDCDDGNAAKHPGAVEICGDLIDQDCDGSIDEGCATVPAAPTGVVATPGTGEITVSWDPVTDAAYTVYWSPNPNVLPTNSTAVPVSGATSHTHGPNLVGGATYYYRVSASNSAGESPLSEEVWATPLGDTPPAAPTNVQAIPCDGGVLISWDPTPGVTFYRIYYSASSGFDKLTAAGYTGGEFTTQFWDRLNLFTNGTTYYFAVTAVTDMGNGLESDLSSPEANATPQPGLVCIGAPANFQAQAGDGQVTLTWDTAPGASSYDVGWSPDPDVQSSGNFSSAWEYDVSSPHVVTGLTNGTEYYFVVIARDTTMGSAPSVEIAATPTAGAAGDTITDASGLGMTLARIPAGTFMMGSAPGEDGDTDELPQHQVTIAQDFYLMTTEVTNAQFVAFLNDVGQRGTTAEPWFETQAEDSASRILGDVGAFYVEAGYENHPVTNVSWYGAKAMADWLSGKEAKTYRLPTEAEWEYAARANPGTSPDTLPFAFGTCLSTDQANYDGRYPLAGCPAGEYRGGTVAVDTLAANAWGLRHMHGNVWEWVEDDRHSDYTGAPVDGSAWVNSPRGASRVLRGGSWSNYARNCRSAYRSYNNPSYRNGNIGFRLALSPG